MNHHIPCPAKPGFNRIFHIGERGMNLTGFGLLKLAAGETWESASGGNEIALVVLGGTCRVAGDGFDFPSVGERPDVFSGYPFTVYIPCGRSYSVTALTAVEVAVSESPSDLDSQPVLVRPDEVAPSFMRIGKDNFTRDAIVMIGDNFATRHFFIGEAWVPSGNWASYPPHRHDADNLPDEIDMEEFYFFRFNPKGGFGIQKVYTDDLTTDAAYTVRENDTVAIPEGYHPVVTAPGYTMYYLWVMTGANNRGFISHKDTAHAAAVAGKPA
jgi:5-deoxy-glucuronate isomerase